MLKTFPNDIGGMDSLKELLKTKVLDVLNKPEHFKKYGVTVPNGMLLYGPPGCGKTFISEKFCEEAGYNFFLIKPSDLIFVSTIFSTFGPSSLIPIRSDNLETINSFLKKISFPSLEK